MPTDLARWQFAFTTINHFLFVPITIGLAFLTALLQTAWHRRQQPEYLRLTRFFGTLLVINVAIGVVTGLVQEFEFGMNWSSYSRLVGNIFGAPLAMEGLAAFFLESTFLGLWLFGWDKLSRRVHLTTIWLVAFGSVLSALFIMAANSWMQHPVGYVTNPKTHLPELNDIWALFTNPVFLWGYAKVIFAALTTGAAVMLAVSAWQLRKGGDRAVFGKSARLRSGRIGPGDPAGHAGRRRTRGDRGPVPADEDRRGRGPVDHLPAVLILAVPDRRRQQRPHPDSDPGNPAPAIASCHQPLERQGHRPDAAAEPILRQVRIRLLRAERLHPVLVHAGDGLPGPDRDRGRALGPVAQPAQEAGDVQAVPLGRAVGGRAAVPDEYGGLAADRVRPAAVDRAGHHADQERAVPVGQHYLPGDQPDRVRAALRGSRHCRLAADAALLAQGTAARARASRPDQPVPAMEY